MSVELLYKISERGFH